jgi:hypothetical protein
LRVLHIRQSGTDLKRYNSLGVKRAVVNQWRQSTGVPEYRPRELTKSLHDLAQWAFGPQGLPSLEVIVYGDFSHQGRYAQSHVYLCRHAGLHQDYEQDMAGQTFRHFSRDDWRQNDELQRFSNMLAACPTSPHIHD